MPKTEAVHNPGPDNYDEWYEEYCREVKRYSEEVGVKVLPKPLVGHFPKNAFEQGLYPVALARCWVDCVIEESEGRSEEV